MVLSNLLFTKGFKLTFKSLSKLINKLICNCPRYRRTSKVSNCFIVAFNPFQVFFFTFKVYIFTLFLLWYVCFGRYKLIYSVKCIIKKNNLLHWCWLQLLRYAWCVSNLIISFFICKNHILQKKMSFAFSQT